MASGIQAVLLVCMLGNLGATMSISLKLPRVLEMKTTQLSDQSALQIRHEIVSGASISKELCAEAGILCGNVIYPPFKQAQPRSEELGGPVYSSSSRGRILMKMQSSEKENLEHFFFRLNKLSNKTIQVPPLTDSKALQSNKFLHPMLRSYFEAMSTSQLLRATGYDTPSAFEDRIVENSGSCKKRLTGEVKGCFLALDAIVEFVASHAGSDHLEFDVPSHQLASLQSFEIVGSKLLTRESLVSCHTIWFPYAVYMCHLLPNTHLYEVSLKNDSDGEVMIVPVVCHMDTSELDPDHISLKIIKAKPGESEMCHWMMSSHIAWYKK